MNNGHFIMNLKQYGTVKKKTFHHFWSPKRYEREVFINVYTTNRALIGF